MKGRFPVSASFTLSRLVHGQIRRSLRPTTIAFFQLWDQAIRDVGESITSLREEESVRGGLMPRAMPRPLETLIESSKQGASQSRL